MSVCAGSVRSVSTRRLEPAKHQMIELEMSGEYATGRGSAEWALEFFIFSDTMTSHLQTEDAVLQVTKLPNTSLTSHFLKFIWILRHHTSKFATGDDGTRLITEPLPLC